MSSPKHTTEALSHLLRSLYNLRVVILIWLILAGIFAFLAGAFAASVGAV